MTTVALVFGSLGFLFGFLVGILAILWLGAYMEKDERRHEQAAREAEELRKKLRPPAGPKLVVERTIQTHISQEILDELIEDESDDTPQEDPALQLWGQLQVRGGFVQVLTSLFGRSDGWWIALQHHDERVMIDMGDELRDKAAALVAQTQRVPGMCGWRAYVDEHGRWYTLAFLRPRWYVQRLSVDNGQPERVPIPGMDDGSASWEKADALLSEYALAQGWAERSYSEFHEAFNTEDTEA